MKKVFLIILLLFLSGCDITYNLTLDDNYLENISIKDYAVQGEDDEFKLALNTGFSLYKDSGSSSNNSINSSFYEYKYRNNDYFDLSLKGKFSPFNNNSNAVFSACKNYEVYREGEFVYLKASNFILFNIYSVDSLKVNIKSSYKVVESNADEVKNNRYTWIINGNNYAEKTIYLKYQLNNEDKDNPMFYFSIGLITFVLIAFVIYFIVKIVYNRNNHL